MNNIFCTYCGAELVPSRPSQTYKCPICNKVFYADRNDNSHFKVQQLILAHAKAFLEELEECLEKGLLVSASALLEAQERVKEATDDRF